jgi:hypothetical protein
MSDLDYIAFQKTLRKIGLYYIPSEETRLYEIALRCSRTVGFATGVAAATYLAGVGMVAVPGVGSIPGALAGFLAGMVKGTAVCTMGLSAVKPQIDQLLRP